MKKKLFSIVIVAAVAAAAAWNYNQSSNEVVLSDVALSNVEALANGESSSGCRWRTGHSSSSGWIAICDSYGVGYSCSCGEIKYY